MISDGISSGPGALELSSLIMRVISGMVTGEQNIDARLEELRYDRGSVLLAGIAAARFGPMDVKKLLKAVETARGSLVSLSCRSRL